VKPSLRWGLVVLGAALFLFALDVWWFKTYRGGFPFDIDEAGYTSFGLVDYLGLHFNGVHGWWEAVDHQSTFGPFVPALTSITVWIHPGILNGFAVLAAFAVVLALASYGVAERLLGPRLGAFVAIVIATLPGTFRFAREYIFALPTAALLMCAVLSILRSDGMRSRRWAIVTGIAIGLLPLTRTMAVSFIPGLVIAMLLPLLLRGDRSDYPRRFVNLGLTAIVAVAVATTWYWRNLHSVVEYLTGYGYGSQSAYYGESHSLISWGRFTAVLEAQIQEDLLLPLAAICLLALVVLVVLFVARLRPAGGRLDRLRTLAASDAGGVCVVFIFGFLALMTSRNGGDGFTTPISVLLPIIAALTLRRFPKATLPTIAVVGLLCVFNTLSAATIWGWASKKRLVDIPTLSESQPWSDGTPHAVLAIREQSPGPEWKFVKKDEGWPRADRRLVGIIENLGAAEGRPAVTAFATRSWDLNTNTVQMAALVKYLRGIPLVQLLAEEGDTVANYKKQLEASGANTLVTASSEAKDFAPVVTQKLAEAAGRELGFRRRRTIDLPNGRTMWVWTKDEAADG
jgi:4-amino-4-deoxy-L-arabinose transferase-like glycosyltransferase